MISSVHLSPTRSSAVVDETPGKAREVDWPYLHAMEERLHRYVPIARGLGIRKAWAADEPFAFNGRYTKLRYVNCWPKPIQKLPPIFIPGGGSVETYDFCLDNTYSYSYLSYSGYLRAKLLMEGYWKRVAERKVDESPYRAGFAQVICVAGFVAQSLPAVPILLPGRACGMPVAPPSLL